METETQKKSLSIIVPAYNMEQYIDRCLKSLLKTEKITESVEVIVVNDGSTDKTPIIVQQYVSAYSCVKLINQPNGGWGSAINAGIQHATGKYFKILDADDWFDNDALCNFIDLLKDINVDLVATSFSYEYADGNHKDNIYNTTLCGKIIDFNAYLCNAKQGKNLPMATITYRTELLQKNNITICNRYYADIDYNLTPLIYVHTIYFSQINLYKYFVGRNGQSTSLEGYKTHINDYLIMAKKIIDFFKLNNAKMEEYVRKAYIKDCFNILKFSYILLMSPTYNSNLTNHNSILKDFDYYIKNNSSFLYMISNRIKKKHIPFVFIWRHTGINLFNLLK